MLDFLIILNPSILVNIISAVSWILRSAYATGGTWHYSYDEYHSANRTAFIFVLSDGLISPSTYVYSYCSPWNPNDIMWRGGWLVG